MKGRKLCLREKNILEIILREGIFEKKAIKEKIDKVFSVIRELEIIIF